MKMIRTFVILFSALFLLLATTSCTPAGAGTPGTTEALQQTTAAATTAPATTETPTTEPVNPYEAMYNKWVAKGYEDPTKIYVAEGVVVPSPAVHALAQVWVEANDQLDGVYTPKNNDRHVFYLYADENVVFVRAPGTKSNFMPSIYNTYDFGFYQFTRSYEVMYGVYKNGVFYEIREAYANSILTRAELEIFCNSYALPCTPVAPREGLDPLPGIEPPEALG